MPDLQYAFAQLEKVKEWVNFTAFYNIRPKTKEPPPFSLTCFV